MVSSGQHAPSDGDHQALSGASAIGVADAPASARDSRGKVEKGRSGNGAEKSEAEIYHERVGCGLFWAVGKFRPTNYMIVSHFLQYARQDVKTASMSVPSGRPAQPAKILTCS